MAAKQVHFSSDARDRMLRGVNILANGDDFALARLFLGVVGNDDAAGRLFLGLDAADQNTVVQRTECHRCDLFHS